jgi:hypothetical protein
MLALNSQAPWNDGTRLFGLATLLMLAPLTGLLIVHAPLVAWVLVGALAALLFLEFSSIYWVVIAIMAATLSRVAVAFGAPHFLNFVHFPLVVGAFVVTLLKGHTSRPARAIGNCLGVFLVVNVASWLINDGELLRPVLNWLVLMEPFLLLYVLLATPVTARTSSLLWKVLLAICFVQVPLGAWQFLTVSRGNPDLIQGSFIGSGTGAHVAGAVTLLGFLILLCRGAASSVPHVKTVCFAAAVPLIGLAVIADAKQSIYCFIPALLFAIVSIKGVHLLKVVLPILFLGLLLYASFYFYRPLQKIEQRGLVSHGLQGKTSAFLSIVSAMSETPTGLLVGIGPGNSVSRVALMTPDAQLDGTSAISALDLKTAPLTRELLDISYHNWLWKSSSVWSPECSWFGLFGDLGFVGVGVYLWMLWLAWKIAGRQGGWLSASAKGSLIALASLGGVYTWLEEPSFTLLVALLIGLAVMPRLKTDAA